MKRILLLIEDYNELIFAETLLKKIGYDCLGLKSEIGVSDKILSFRPNIALVSAYGSKIHPKPISEKLSGSGASLLILFRGTEPTQEELEDMGADGALQSPFHPKHLIGALAHLSGEDPQAMVDKFEKLGLFKDHSSSESGERKSPEVSHTEKVSGKVLNEEDGTLVSSDEKPDMSKSNHSGVSREERYSQYLQSIPKPKVERLDKKRVQEWTKKIRSEAGGKDLEELDEKKKDFVRALFRKK